jgi:hypothetical protein
MKAVMLTTVAMLAAATFAHAAGVHAIMLGPPSVEPDSSFTVSFNVTPADAAFNSFSAVFSFDPAALTLQPLSPTSSQQGCLMVGGCGPVPQACGTTFHRFAAAADSAKADDSALCDQWSTVGPGPLYTLRFKAAHTEQHTTIHVRSASFFNGGIGVTPVATQDIDVDIHRTVSVGPDAGSVRLAVSALPNPARGALALSIRASQAGEQRVDVLDAAGRLVRTLESGWFAAGTRSLAWDGADEGGQRMPSGVYLARVSAGGTIANTRIVILH